MGFLNILKTLVTGKDERDELKKTPRVLPEGLKPDITFQPSRDAILQPSEQEKIRPDIFDLSEPQTYQPEMTVSDVKDLTYGNPASRANPLSGILSGLGADNLADSAKTADELNRRYNKNWKLKKSEGGDGDDDHNWWDVVKSVGLGFLQGGLPGAVVGGFAGGFDKNADERWFNNQNINKLQKQYESQVANEGAQLKNRLAQEQINTIPIDDENRRLQIETQREIARERTQSQALSKLNALKVFDPSNTAHRALAQQAGQDPNEIKGWDLRNPVEHSVGGVRFRLNRETGRYEETNLPKDEEKSLVDFKTKDGKTYRVSARTAATLQTQFDTLGMRQEFQATENQKAREHQVRLKELGSQMQIQLEAIKTANDMAKSAQNAQQKAEHQQRAQDATKEYIRLRAEAKALQ